MRGAPYVTTPVLDRGIYNMVKEGGIVSKLEIATGRLLQEERVPGVWKLFRLAGGGDGKIYFANEAGMVSVLASQPEWKVISSREFHEKIYATPAFGAGCLCLRTEQALYCFQARPEFSRCAKKNRDGEFAQSACLPRGMSVCLMANCYNSKRFSRPATYSGVGLHSGGRVNMTFFRPRPAPHPVPPDDLEGKPEVEPGLRTWPKPTAPPRLPGETSRSTPSSTCSPPLRLRH